MSKWAIRLMYDEPIWTCNGEEILFDTEEQAIAALDQEIAEQEEDVALGFLEDVSYEEYRIVEIV